MLIEIGLGMVATSGITYYKYRNYIKENRMFNNCCKLKNKNFHILNTTINDYGTEFIISLKDKEFKDLESLKDLLYNNFKGDVEIEQNKNSTATIKIIKNEIGGHFVPLKLKAHEIYLGLDNHYEPIIVNMNSYPHVLITGSTGSGKTQELKLLLTNLIYSNSERDINIHFSNISESNDFKEFLGCIQVKSYMEKIEESLKLFEYINHLYSKRLEIFKKYNVTDIKEYNKKYQNKKMSYQYLILDEFADYYPNNKLEEDYNIKVQCYNILKHLVRKARKAGIFIILALQRSDNESMDASLKSNINTKIGFSQNNNPSSLVITGDYSLTGLEPRKFVTIYGSNKIWSKSLYIDDSMIKKYVNNSICKHTLNTFLEPNRAIQKDNKVIDIKKKTIKKKKDEVAVSRVKNIEVIELKQGKNV